MATTTTSTPADINARDDDGRTKIYLAAEAGNAAEVARLLKLQADFDLPTTDDYMYLSLLNDVKIYQFFSISFYTDARHFILPARMAMRQLFVCCSKPARTSKQKTATGLRALT